MTSTETAVAHGAVQTPGWDIAWAQIVGIHHRVTEDTCDYRLPADYPGRLSLALADGVGGGARGDVASQALVQHCLALPDSALGDEAAMDGWLRQADAEVQRALRQVTFSPGAATLAAAWLQADGSGHCLRVGDARLYHFSAQGETRRQTQDQTYAHLGLAPPADASLDDPASMVGTGFMGEPELPPLCMAAGEWLLLCSDGLHRGIDAAGMAGHLLAHANLEEACIALAQAARAAGSEDDISLLVAKRLKANGVRQLDSCSRWWHKFVAIFT
jgi:protein phosphatase